MNNELKVSLSLLLIGSIGFFQNGCRPTTQMYPPAPIDTLTFRTLPATRQLLTSLPDDYFKVNNSLFRNLFNYLNEHQLTMTIPVRVTIATPCTMSFYVAPNDYPRAVTSTKKVRVIECPSATIAVLAFRGKTTRTRVEIGIQELQRRIAEEGHYTMDGAFYVTYWDAPIWPSFLRHYEITVPVIKVPTLSSTND